MPQGETRAAATLAHVALSATAASLLFAIARPLFTDDAWWHLALGRAYARAGYGADTVGYFEGHGTGTAVGDATELEVLTTARREAGATSPAPPRRDSSFPPS